MNNNETIKLRREDIRESNVHTEINIATLNRVDRGSFLQTHLNIDIDPSKPINEKFKYLEEEVVKNFNTRVKIDTGKFCNARCQFCYYFSSLTNRDFLSLDEIKEQGFIPELYKKGITEFEFSGGEPTLNWELPEIIDYIKEQGKEFGIEPKFSIVSNGFKLQECIDANPDIKEVLISLHGNDVEHPKITRISKSYEKIMEFITTNLLAHRKGQLLIRVNVVVTGTNMTQDFMTTLFCLLLNGIQVNLLPLNFWDDASNGQNQDTPFTKKQKSEIYYSINKFIRYVKGDKGNSVYKIINQLKQYNKDKFELFKLNETSQDDLMNALMLSVNEFKKKNTKLINIRYAEVCKLSDLARVHAVNHIKHFFDRHDWNKFWYPLDNKDISYEEPGSKNNFDFTREPSIAELSKVLYQDRIQSNYVDDVCRKCNLFISHHCDGLKYIDQKEKTIFKETSEEHENRKRFKDKRYQKLKSLKS